MASRQGLLRHALKLSVNIMLQLQHLEPTGLLSNHLYCRCVSYVGTVVSGQTGVGTSVAPACIPQNMPNPDGTQQPLHGKKLGVYWDWFNDAAPDVVDACKATLNEMCRQGAEVTLATQLR